MGKIPSFLTEKEDALIYNGDGQLLYYIPERYFVDKKFPIASQVGLYVITMGVFDWALVSSSGKVSPSHIFEFPTMIKCKPSSIEKVKDFSIDNKYRAMDYRILHFNHGDEAISELNPAQSIENVETLFKMMAINSNNIPSTIPYDKVQDYFQDNINLNGNDYNVNMQVLGAMVSEMFRDPKDLSKPFRHSKMTSMTDGIQISMRDIPKYISPAVSIYSTNWDEALMSAIMLSDEDDKNIKYSPLEKVLMQ